MTPPAASKPAVVYPFPRHINAEQRRVALVVAAAFAVAGAAWVLATDYLLYTLTSDPVVIARFETAKGWTFVALAAVLVYAVAWRATRLLARARAAISAVVDSIADGVLVLGPDRQVVGANPAAVRMLGCANLDELIGMTGDAFVRRFRVTRPDGSPLTADALISQRAFDDGGTLRHKVMLDVGGDEPLVVSVTAAAVRSNLTETTDLVVSVMHDVTEAENFERLRDQFFSAAAHSLKTPLTIIKGQAQLLALGATTTPDRSAAAIERQCGRIDRLVQNLLVLARLRSRTLELHREDLDLADLADRVVREMSAASPHHHLRLDSTGVLHVHGDEERLAMVLRSMLDEATTCASPESVITVSTSLADSGATVQVGYPPQAPEAWQVQGHPESDVLGVAREVAAAIARAHGGILTREEIAGRAIIRLRLPNAGRP